MFIYATPAGFIALEAGWTVTEVGRQPWIIQGIMRTSEAVTPMPGIQYSFYLFTFIYFTLSIFVIFLLKRQIQMVPELYDR
jgi:cytochrome d ubiquinol oxidase subunit I